MFKFLAICLTIAILFQANFASETTQNDNTTEEPTTSALPTTLTTEQTTATTTALPTTETTVTTEQTTVTSTTTTSAPTTEPKPTTQAETTAQPVTTTQAVPTTTSTAAPSNTTVLKFTVPRNQPNATCLRVDLSLMMDIKYKASKDGNVYNTSLKVALPADFNDYDGECSKSLSTLRVQFWNNWTLEMDYSIKNAKFQLSSVVLSYYLNSTWFPNATPDSFGVYTVNASNLHEFEAPSGSSYKCKASTILDLGSGVTLNVTNYQAEAFSESYKGDFDIAVDCAADNEGTKKIVPIIVGSALAVLIVLVLIAYLIGRRRHRSGYQTV